MRGAFDRCKQSPGDVSLRPQDFIRELANQLGDAFVRRSGIEDDLPSLVSYLAEDVPDQISYRKLQLALSREERDAPLQQAGAQEIKEYQAGLREGLLKKGAPGSTSEVAELAKHLASKNLGISDLFPKQLAQATEISVSQFRTALSSLKAYKPKDLERLIEELQDTKGPKQPISMKRLKQEVGKAQAKPSVDYAKNKIASFPPKVQGYLQDISKYLEVNQMTLDELHRKLDMDGDGKVDKMEFVTRMKALAVPGLLPQDLGLIFDSIDVNADQSLSVEEFRLFLQGAKLTKDERIKRLDPSIQRQFRDEIRALFDSFDQDGDGRITADEIYRTLQSFGIKKTIEQCNQMIRASGSRQDFLDQHNFEKMMLPLMLEEMLGQEDSVEDMRAMFLEADVDHSGFLSVEQLWHVINKEMGAECQLEDIIELMSEIDVDKDGQLDIDEFLSLLSLGDRVHFQSEQSQNTFLKIKKARRVDPLDFLKCFKNMPSNFAPSFVEEQWVQHRRHLPSSVFKAQVDPCTMLWKDVLPLKSEDMPSGAANKGHKPLFLPIESIIGCSISLQDAQGVPLPQVSDGGFSDGDIVKRAIRIAIDRIPKHGTRREFVHNAVQVPAMWRKEDEDIWSFDSSEKGLSTVLFRSTKQDNLDNCQARLLFELVVYVKSNNNKNNKARVTEMSCGWCELPVEELARGFTHKLTIHGGSPSAEVEIKDADLRTNRTGFKLVAKVFNNKVEKRLQVEVKPLAKLPQEVKSHLELMPSTCLVHRSMLYFASGFMNYKAERLLRETAAGAFRKPPGDVVLSAFPTIFDSPDIFEELVLIWGEDIQPMIDKGKKLDIEFIMTKTKEVVSRLYPILYCEEFVGLEHASTRSEAGNPDLLTRRKKLIQSSLRFGVVHPVKQKVAEAPCELTTFRPFSVRELEYDVWDKNRQKKDRFLNHFGGMGLLGNGNGRPEASAPPTAGYAGRGGSPPRGDFNSNQRSQPNYDDRYSSQQPAAGRQADSGQWAGSSHMPTDPGKRVRFGDEPRY